MISDGRPGDVVGKIKRRLLVNTWVDPDEAARHLPDGVRPHLGTNGGVVVGCCMIEIKSARPWPFSRLAGISIRAAAHRISVEVGPAADPTTAVWVPVRQTDSVPAVLAGGRIFPGVHVPTQIDVTERDEALKWSVGDGVTDRGKFDIDASVDVNGTPASNSEVAAIVIGAKLGLSPGRRSGRIEAVEMLPAVSSALIVEQTQLISTFLDSFSSGTAAESLLMTDVDVAWRRSSFSI